MAQSSKAIRHELKMLSAAIAPQLSEFCDGWVLIGVRAGTTDQAMHLTHTRSRKELRQLESVLANVALEIVRKRQCARRRKR